MANGGLAIQKGILLPHKKSQLPDHRKDMEAKLRSASEMYEQQFLDMMVKQMRKTVPESEFMQKSFAQNLYEQQLDQKYVNTWASKGGIGIADMIYNQLHEKIFPKQLGRPQGPLLLPSQKSPLPIEKAGNASERGVKVIPETSQGKVSSQNSTLGLRFVYPNSSEQVIGGSKDAVDKSVLAPWKGVVHSVTQGEGGMNLVKVTHDGGILSSLGFSGDLSPGLSAGDAVGAGQVLGRVSPRSQELFWRVSERS